jgi:aspartate/tyrosine/aromatic aminotransferase
MLFKTHEMAPPDPIFHLKEAFAQDTNPAKIDLSVGVYKDTQGKTSILASVKHAEDIILNAETSKSYLGISGSSEYGQTVQALLFGAGHELIASKRAMTAHTPGGTGALRVAGDLFKRVSPQTRIWVGDPTWQNHPNVFLAAGLQIETYPYWDKTTNGLALDQMLSAIRQIPQGNVVLLHGCCHNPTKRHSVTCRNAFEPIIQIHRLTGHRLLPPYSMTPSFDPNGSPKSKKCETAST